MQGYGVMVDELTDSWTPSWPTHVFTQARCWRVRRRPVRAHLAYPRCVCLHPHFVVVVRRLRGALVPERRRRRDPDRAVMAGLAVGEPSVPAWEILAVGADAFLTISDETGMHGDASANDPHGDDAPRGRR